MNPGSKSDLSRSTVKLKLLPAFSFRAKTWGLIKRFSLHGMAIGETTKNMICSTKRENLITQTHSGAGNIDQPPHLKWPLKLPPPVTVPKSGQTKFQTFGLVLGVHLLVPKLKGKPPKRKRLMNAHWLGEFLSLFSHFFEAQ